MFMVSPTIDTGTLEQIFRHKVLKMLLAKGKITRNMIDIMDKWRHRGFNAYCGQGFYPGKKNLWRIWPGNVSRGKRKKAKVGNATPCILEPELTDKAFRRNWARLIQKIY